MLFREINRPSSLRQVIVGVGEPVAEQRNVTLDPSRTTMSVLVCSSRISGGTATFENYLTLLKYCKSLVKMSIFSLVRNSLKYSRKCRLQRKLCNGEIFRTRDFDDFLYF